jgi:hypothetical protein
MLLVDAWAVLRSLKNPVVLAKRLRFRLWGKDCPIVRAILTTHRRIPEDRESWLRQVALSHAS